VSKPFLCYILTTAQHKVRYKQADNPMNIGVLMVYSAGNNNKQVKTSKHFFTCYALNMYNYIRSK